jgi:hypothetical protein
VVFELEGAGAHVVVDDGGEVFEEPTARVGVLEVEEDLERDRRGRTAEDTLVLGDAGEQLGDFLVDPVFARGLTAASA